MIQVTLTVTASQLALIAAIMGGEPAATPAADPNAKPRKVDKTAKPEAPVETAAQPEVTGKDAAGEEVAEVPSADDAKAAAQKLAAKNGRDALVEMLGKFKATQLSGLAEGDRAAFIEACEAALS